MTDRALSAEIAAFLERHGPSTSSQIAAGVRARRQTVDAALLAGTFQQAPAPEGASPRARHWVALGEPSQAVPQAAGGQSRAGLMLAVLRDGKRHSRAEIFRKSGRYFLTNNAASELRRLGYDVRHDYERRHVVVYWLVTAAAKPLPIKARTISGRVRLEDVA